MVLLLLYPIVFLFGIYVVNPYLLGWAKLPFPVALFLSNVASIILLNYLVPWTSNHFTWWLSPPGKRSAKVDLAGAALISILYALLVLVFTLFI